MYAEVHLPILTKNGLDIRGGRFYSPAGFENVQAIKRPLLSVPYLFNYTPFTLFGVLTTLHLNERINIYNGAVNGWDRWIDQNYRYSLHRWRQLQLARPPDLADLDRPDRPRPAPPVRAGELAVLADRGDHQPGLQGKVNPYYAGNWRTYMSTVLTHNYNAKLTEAAEVFFVHETNVPGLGPNGSVGKESAWYGCVRTGSSTSSPTRSRASGGPKSSGTTTARPPAPPIITTRSPWGRSTSPKPWLWVRPEARYDRAQYTHPFNDGTRNSQLTLAFDIIVQF